MKQSVVLSVTITPC